MKQLIISLLLLLITGCVPNTYYSTTDEYVVGLRWNDRGDYASAAKYWDPLVSKGDCDAEYMVGQLYFLGRAKPQDNDKAIALWEKAANANQQRAQWAIADLYYQNSKVTYHTCKTCNIEKNNVKALQWYMLFEKSAKYDGEKKYLAHILPHITSEMSAEEITKATKQAKTWKPSPKDCGARNLW